MKSEKISELTTSRLSVYLRCLNALHAAGIKTVSSQALAEQFNLKLTALQIGATRYGKNPMTKSFLELKEEGLHISAVKRSENGTGWVVRLFNPFDRTVKDSIRLNGGFTGPGKTQSPVERVEAEFELPKGKGHTWSKARLVSLEELPQEDLAVDGEGWIDFEISKKKILTIEVIP